MSPDFDGIVIFPFYFNWENRKNYKDVIFAGVDTKQACFLYIWRI